MPELKTGAALAGPGSEMVQRGKRLIKRRANCLQCVSATPFRRSFGVLASGGKRVEANAARGTFERVDGLTPTWARHSGDGRTPPLHLHAKQARNLSLQPPVGAGHLVEMGAVEHSRHDSVLAGRA